MKNLTTISVQGNEQEVFEVYADDTGERTAGFVFDEEDADLFEHALWLRDADPLMFKLASAHGTITVMRNGIVFCHDLDFPGFGSPPVYVNVREWMKRYPGEEPWGKTHDILDFGFIDADGVYTEPEEEWRKDREAERPPTRRTKEKTL